MEQVFAFLEHLYHAKWEILEIYPKEYGSPREARQGIGAYMKLYNERRLHESLGYHTPFEVYSGQVKVSPIVK